MKRSLRLKWFGIALMILSGSTAFAQSTTITQTPNASACTGDSLTFQVTLSAGYLANNSFDIFMTPGNAGTADFTDPATEQLPIAKWLPNSGNPAQDTNSSLTFKTVTIIIPETITTNGTYSIRMESDNPATFSNIFEVAVNVTIPAEIDTANIKGAFRNNYTPGNPDDFGKCVDDTIVLYANQGFNYQWMVNGVDVRIAQAGRTDDRYDSLLVWLPGDYSVEVSSGPVCPGTSDPVTIVNYIPSPMITFGNPVNQIQPWIVFLDDPFPALVTDSVQFCETDSVMVYGGAPQLPGEVYTYQWYRDSVTQFGVDTFIPIPGAANDTFWFNAGHMANAVTPFEMRLFLEVTDTTTGCSTLGADPKWLFMDTVPDTEISAIPWPGNANAPTIICIEDSVLLGADATGTDWDYQWQARFPLNGGTWTNIPNDTNPRLQVDTTLIPDSAEYRLVISNVACTWITAPIQVNIVPLPNFQFLPSDSVAICADDSVLIAINGNGLQYTWSNGFIGTSQYLSTPGTYWVQARGVNQCISYDTLILFPLVVNADAGPNQTIGQDEDVVMAASGGVSYYWYADEPVYFSNQRDPNTLSRPVKDTTWYFVEVTAANGCTAIDSMLVIVEDPFAGGPNLSNVQNVMTPNGDGANDVFDLSEVVRTDGCDLIIMNRWGSEVYTEENYTSGWTGVDNGGNELPDGTYYYVLACGDEIRFKGAITILRNND
ncbi:MAG: gliding motility-associated C-terminal domain-containing protein [Flavobacteriia bacterium]|nr:gliding motility-associated C-terminal domain-containing protein [Flavobacteriia bacterium]